MVVPPVYPFQSHSQKVIEPATGMVAVQTMISEYQLCRLPYALILEISGILPDPTVCCCAR